MSVLYFIEPLRMPLLDRFFLFVTNIGDEAFILILTLIIFWCLNKKHGYFMVLVIFYGLCANMVLKIMFRIPRPWEIDKNFTIVEKARERAMDYSFPSGHTQNSISTLGSVAVLSTEKIISILCWIGVALVAFSRMYLGVHQPKDVLVSLLVGGLLIFIFTRIYSKIENDRKKMTITFGILVFLAMLAVVLVWMFKGHIMDSGRYEDSIKNAYDCLGATLGFFAGYQVEDRYIRFSVQASLKTQILKVVLGIAAILAVRTGLKMLFGWIAPGVVLLEIVRYFVIVFVGIAVVPSFFPKAK